MLATKTSDTKKQLRKPSTDEDRYYVRFAGEIDIKSVRISVENLLTRRRSVDFAPVAEFRTRLVNAINEINQI